MKINIIEKKYKATDKMKEKMDNKLSKFDKIFVDGANAQIKLSKEKDREICEITVNYKDAIFRAEHTSADMYTSFDECIENFKKQVRKYKTKIEKYIKSEPDTLDFSDFISEEDEAYNEEFNIIKSKKLSVKPMYVEEAILQMNLLNHQFFIFKNAQTDGIDIVYKRKDGNYGLIETE